LTRRVATIFSLIFNVFNTNYLLIILLKISEKKVHFRRSEGVFAKSQF
jgi:hypothetical protein